LAPLICEVLEDCGCKVELKIRSVRYLSASRSPTLGKNEKIEQHIRKKTRKLNALRFWVEGGVIPLYVVWLNSHC